MTNQALEHPRPGAGFGDDLAAVLQSLRHLYDQGVLSEAEYQAKKEAIIARY
jgi:hypothetical protein